MSQPTQTAGRGSRVFTILASATILALSGVFAFASENAPSSVDTPTVTTSVSSGFSADLSSETSSGAFGVGTGATSSSAGGGGTIPSPSTGN